VTNRRGQLLAVVDLAYYLTRSASKNSDAGFVLMLRRPGREIGLKVDSIEDLIELHMENLSLSPQWKLVRGIASGTLLLLDMEKLLAEVFSHEETVSA
jgi:purine-binding chemotaxis protein CheW